MFRKKIEKGDRVRCHITWFNGKHVDRWQDGTVEGILPNPFAPDWLVRPNYLVQLDEPERLNCPDVFERKDLKLIKGFHAGAGLIKKINKKAPFSFYEYFNH